MNDGLRLRFTIGVVMTLIALLAVPLASYLQNARDRDVAVRGPIPIRPSPRPNLWPGPTPAFAASPVLGEVRD
jgi:hypothetical protein